MGLDLFILGSYGTRNKIRAGLATTLPRQSDFLNTKDLSFFEFFLLTEALLRCRVVAVAKLNNLSRAQLWPFDGDFFLQLS